MKNKLNKDINAICEQSDDLIDKIRDELRHKKEEEKRRVDTCQDIQQQITTLEEQFDSMAIESQDPDDLQAEWDRVENERKKMSEQQAQISTKQQQINDEMRRIQQDIQSRSNK